MLFIRYIAVLHHSRYRYICALCSTRNGTLILKTLTILTQFLNSVMFYLECRLSKKIRAYTLRAIIQIVKGCVSPALHQSVIVYNEKPCTFKASL